MRVGFLTHNYPRFQGDHSGAFIEELVRALPREVGVHVLCPHAQGLKLMETRENVTIHRFRYAKDERETLAYEGKMLNALKRGLNGWNLLLRFNRAFVEETRRLSMEFSLDIVHAHWLLPAGIAAQSALRNSRIPLVLSIHGTDLRLTEKIFGGKAIARRLLKRAALVLPVSGYLGEKVDRLAGRRVKKDVLPMPASEMFLAPPRKKLLRKVIAVGNLTAQKRFGVLIRALGLLAMKGLDFPLTLVGDGPDFGELKGLSRVEGVDIEFMGRTSHQDLPKIFAEAGVLVLPSVAEGFGMALVEAQLSGLAVIGADAGGQRDIIDNKETGLLVEPDNPQVLAEAIEELYKNEAATLAMTRRGQDAARRRFLPAPTAHRLVEIYRKVLS